MKDKKIKKNVTAFEYIRLKALGLLGLIDSNIDPRSLSERLTFVNNINEIKQNKLHEYNIWYGADSDEILNFFTRANTIEYNFDPLFNRNKKSYFWARASTESDYKRTHSGQPRNIVDTLVGIIGNPMIGVKAPANANAVLKAADDKLRKILKDNNFKKLLVQRARPLTLVEGWGAWKINWNKDFRNTPILLYYRADAVDFICKNNQLIAIIYKDYYQDEKKNNYILFETRRIEIRQIASGEKVPCLIIEKDIFKISGTSEVLTPCNLKDIPQLKDTAEAIIIENFDRLLGVPNIYYDDSTEDLPGRSIFTGKEDLFDDLDQCLSQSSNSVSRSTPTEVWDVNYLERDKSTGMPIMPHSFDRKYISFRGARGGDGAVNTTPVQTTQPQINFEEYSKEAVAILIQILNGIMSPATLGLDVGKTERSGESAREKEKVTIFTRNIIIDEEHDILEDLCQQLLMAEELQRTGKITCKNYDVYVKYNEFADSSFESKIETVLTAYQGNLMTEEMAVNYLYGDNISEANRQNLIKFMKEQREKDEMPPQGPYSEEELGEMGAEMGGNNNNPHNDEAMSTDIDAAEARLGVPELGEYDKIHNRAKQSDVEKEVLGK